MISDRLDMAILWRRYQPSGVERRAILSPLEAELERERRLAVGALGAEPPDSPAEVERNAARHSAPVVSRPSFTRRASERPSPGECLGIALLCLLTPPVLVWVYCGGPEWLGRLLEGR